MSNCGVNVLSFYDYASYTAHLANYFGDVCLLDNVVLDEIISREHQGIANNYLPLVLVGSEVIHPIHITSNRRESSKWGIFAYIPRAASDTRVRNLSCLFGHSHVCCATIDCSCYQRMAASRTMCWVLHLETP